MLDIYLLGKNSLLFFSFDFSCVLFPFSAFHFVCVYVFFFGSFTALTQKMCRKSLKFNHIHNISICIASRDTSRHNWLQLKQEFNRINSLHQFFSRVNCIHTKRIVFRNTQNGGLSRCAPCISTNEGKKSILDGWCCTGVEPHWKCVCARLSIYNTFRTHAQTDGSKFSFLWIGWVKRTCTVKYNTCARNVSFCHGENSHSLQAFGEYSVLELWHNEFFPRTEAWCRFRRKSESSPVYWFSLRIQLGFTELIVNFNRWEWVFASTRRHFDR